MNWRRDPPGLRSEPAVEDGGPLHVRLEQPPAGQGDHRDPRPCHPRQYRGGGIMLAAISGSDQSVAFDPVIRSHGLPDCWAQAAVYYAVAGGSPASKDAGVAFDDVTISASAGLSPKRMMPALPCITRHRMAIAATAARWIARAKKLTLDIAALAAQGPLPAAFGQGQENHHRRPADSLHNTKVGEVELRRPPSTSSRARW